MLVQLNSIIQLFVLNMSCKVNGIMVCLELLFGTKAQVLHDRVMSSRASARILKLPIIFERVPVQYGPKWAKIVQYGLKCFFHQS